MALSMNKWKGKVAIVTGTTSGIGCAIATQLVDAGLNVVGLARRREKGEELVSQLSGRKGKFYHLTTDVTNEQDVLRAFKWIDENLGPVHILINNAGTMRSTTLMDGDTQMWKEVMDTNVLGLCITTREAVKNMKINNVNGHIVHINSMAGHSGYPPVVGTNIYSASKYAVTALTETLRQELNSLGSKIKISSVSPGIVDTEIFRVSSLEKCKEYSPDNQLTPEDVGDAVLYILSTPPHVQVHDIQMRPQGQTI